MTGTLLLKWDLRLSRALLKLLEKIWVFREKKSHCRLLAI
jgi:hypothetical protein